MSTWLVLRSRKTKHHLTSSKNSSRLLVIYSLMLPLPILGS